MATYYEYNSVTGFLIGTYEVPPNPVRPSSTLTDYSPIPPIRAKWNGAAWVNDPAQENQAVADAALLAAQTWSVSPSVGQIITLAAAAPITAGNTTIITAAVSGTYLLPVAPPSGTTVLVGAAGIGTVGLAQATLDAGVGVVVAGRTRFLALTAGTCVLLRWNGVQWVSFTTQLDSPWVDGGPIGLAAITVNPVKGTTSRDKFWWARSGGDLMVRYEYRQTAVGAATNGTGQYLFTLPFPADVTKAFATTATNDFDPYASTLGPARYIRNADSVIGAASLYDATRFRISGLHLGSPVATSDNTPVNSAIGLNNANVAFSASIRVPIVNW